MQQTGATRSRVRPEIQALRALAVASVVLYHFWPRLAPAGFVGVDVFFVVSGFLITGMLLREVQASGGIRLREFYTRRIRRILPAATVVILFTVGMTIAFAPRNFWGQYLDESLSSLLYVQNWDLAIDSQVPSRDELRSSPVQHFWSLSVEEQFYLVWPLLMIVGLWIAARYARNRFATVLVILGVVTTASFVYNVVQTADDHNLAYFSTFSRAWEFGVGGLLAAIPAVTGDRLKRTRSAASWLGLAAIVVSVLTLTDPETFPGWLVLIPVAGTLAVIWAGTPASPWSTGWLARWAPVQWLGDISYSLYLWHWPIVMFTPFITGQPTETPGMLGLLVLSLLVAWASKAFIEDPIRFGRRGHARPPLRAVWLGLVAASLVIACAIATADVVREKQDPTACESRSEVGQAN